MGNSYQVVQHGHKAGHMPLKFKGIYSEEDLLRHATKDQIKTFVMRGVIRPVSMPAWKDKE